MNRKEQLESEIRKHNDLYWNQTPEISDVEYDKLVQELAKIDPDNELVTSFAVPNLDSSKLIQHSKPMLSLDKVYSKEDLLKWIRKVARAKNEKFLIQPKYDGMSGLLENGKLSSRGDGKVGQDYTDKLKIVEFDTTKRIDPAKDTYLGEIIIRNSDFASKFSNVFSKSGKKFKNQRNAVAGIVGTDDADFYAKQGVKIAFVDYDLNSIEATEKEIEENWEKYVKQTQCVDYPLDGIVVRLADRDYGMSLGATEHHPKDAIAFKFTNITRTSKLIDIEWSMGKEQLAAVGIVEPVDFDGVTVKRVKLQVTKPINTDVETYLADGSLQIGDFVTIERAGDIIPHVVSSASGTSRKPGLISTCPFCGSKVDVSDSQIICTNDHCPEKEIQKLYFSVMTLGFKGIGEAYVRNLHDICHCKNVLDLLKLKKEDLSDQCFGDKMKDTFFSQISKAKNECTYQQFLVSLNIDGLGKNVAKLLIQTYSQNEVLDFLISSQAKNELMKIQGIGYETASKIAESIKDKIDDAKEASTYFKFNIQETISQSLTICFTGKMSLPRSKMEELARAKGFVPVDHVDKKTDILVCADPNSGSNKLKTAAKNGTKIISEAEFMNK